MQLLKSHLSPRIQSSIAHHLRQPSKYEAALKALRNLYGNPQMAARAHVTQLMTIPSVKCSRCCSAGALTTFSVELRDYIATLESSSCNVKLQSDANLDRILSKIPTDLRVNAPN